MGSLRYQFLSCTDKAFSPGMNKHSYKKQGHSKRKIPSYRYKRNLDDFANNLVNFLRDNYPEVKNLKDIKDFHITSFFEVKSTMVSRSTLVQYKSYISTFDKLIQQNFHFKINMIKGVPDKFDKGDKVRKIYMKQEHIDMILELRKNSKSPALLGLKISNLFGLRACEIVQLRSKDFDINKKVLSVLHSKGKKDRFLNIDTPEKLALAIEIREKFNDDEKVVPIRENTYNKFISDSLKKLGITEYKKAKTGNHSIRKKVAIKETQKALEEGLSEQEALEYTAKFLGHNRTNIVKSAYTSAE